jgi:hypothetical protein
MFTFAHFSRNQSCSRTICPAPLEELRWWWRENDYSKGSRRQQFSTRKKPPAEYANGVEVQIIRHLSGRLDVNRTALEFHISSKSTAA